jgi:hypothetical protein
MPKLRNESFLGAGDFRWLRSGRGIWTGRTESLDMAAFTQATHFPNGYIPSGTPCALVTGQLVPYDSLEATVAGAGVLAGHLFTDQPVVFAGGAFSLEDLNVPLLDTGRVNPAFVPVGVQAFVVPVAYAKRSNVTIVYR